MKIRVGYVTNSSSTNFLILSKEELTVEYLYKKLGFKKNSPIKKEAMELCHNILYATQGRLRYFGFDEVNLENVEKAFGTTAAEKFRKYKNKGYKGYMGYTSSDEGTLTAFFTTDSFELEERGIYIYARDCTW